MDRRPSGQNGCHIVEGSTAAVAECDSCLEVARATLLNARRGELNL